MEQITNFDTLAKSWLAGVVYIHYRVDAVEREETLVLTRFCGMRAEFSTFPEPPKPRKGPPPPSAAPDTPDQ